MDNRSGSVAAPVSGNSPGIPTIVSKDTLLLFDIDGTLIASGGAGERALQQAVHDLFGEDSTLDGIEIAGRTDSRIARQILQRHGRETNTENIRAFLDCYLNRLVEQLPVTQGAVLPGILDLLQILNKRPNVVNALLTGNLSRGAELKLTRYGLWDYFDFGAYADDSHDRNALGAFARERALNRHGVEFHPDRIFVIGDTPYDIECGKAFGAKTVAVATGGYSMETLAEHSPDVLLPDLSQIPRVLQLLGLS